MLIFEVRYVILRIVRNIIKYVLEFYPLSYLLNIYLRSPEATNTIASRHIKKRKAITDI